MAAEVGAVLFEFSPKAEFKALSKIAEKSLARLSR